MAILEKLKELEQSNTYPFHMPGHKRQYPGDGFPYGIDITEIDGFDDLHHPEGILKEAQDRAAEVYSAKKAYYLVNGSTCGILAAISAAVPQNGKVLAAANCHKAVYHALALRGAKVTYLTPAVNRYGICGAITADLVRDAMGDYDACILTSPTYEGVVSPIREIAGLLHERNIPLIVDQAHGAHFGFAEGFPESAVRQGADAVIVSLHKTLPAPTQTALLLLASDRIDPGKIDYYLDVYETSSPSYVLMAAMEKAIEYAAEEKEAWTAYSRRLTDFYAWAETAGEQENRKEPEILRTDDPGKIIITGNNIGKRLRKDYAIEVEMESLSYAVLMTSLMDTDAGFERLKNALSDMKRIDGQDLPAGEEGRSGFPEPDFETKETIKQPSEISMGEALEAQSQALSPEEAIGRRAGEFVYVYPPGIPVLVPGEVIKEEQVAYLKRAQKQGLDVKGTRLAGKICVIKE